jgi:hypothetical protein
MIPLFLAAASDPAAPNWGIIITIIAVLLNMGTMIVVATWALSKVRESSSVVAESVAGLRSAVGELKDSILESWRKHQEHGERIARLEEKTRK